MIEPTYLDRLAQIHVAPRQPLHSYTLIPLYFYTLIPLTLTPLHSQLLTLTLLTLLTSPLLHVQDRLERLQAAFGVGGRA
jgi:hypothetical protein